MKRLALFIGILLLAGFGYRNFGPIGFIAAFLGGVFVWWLIYSSKNAPAKVWRLVATFAFLALLLGGFWTVVIFFATGPMIAIGCLIILYGFFELWRYAKRRMKEAPGYNAL